MTRLLAIPLYEEGCDYKTAAEARNALLRNEEFHMEPRFNGKDRGLDCPVLHMAKWRPRTAGEFPDKTLITILFHHTNSSRPHQITVQLGRCPSCGSRIDLAKGLSCGGDCERIRLSKLPKEVHALPTDEVWDSKGKGSADYQRVIKMIRSLPRETLRAMLDNANKKK